MCEKKSFILLCVYTQVLLQICEKNSFTLLCVYTQVLLHICGKKFWILLCVCTQVLFHVCIKTSVFTTVLYVYTQVVFHTSGKKLFYLNICIYASRVACVSKDVSLPYFFMCIRRCFSIYMENIYAGLVFVKYFNMPAYICMRRCCFIYMERSLLYLGNIIIRRSCFVHMKRFFLNLLMIIRVDLVSIKYVNMPAYIHIRRSRLSSIFRDTCAYLYIHLWYLVIYRSLFIYIRRSVVCRTLLIHSRIHVGLVPCFHVTFPQLYTGLFSCLYTCLPWLYIGLFSYIPVWLYLSSEISRASCVRLSWSMHKYTQV